jgi:hypothetical protein
MEKKMTKKEVFGELKVLAENAKRADLVDAIEHEIELLEHKNAIRSKAETKVQKENKILKEKILAVMESGRLYRASEIYNLMSEDFQEKGYTSNKSNSLITQLKNDGLVTRSVEKGIAYFSKND